MRKDHMLIGLGIVIGVLLMSVVVVLAAAPVLPALAAPAQSPAQRL